MKSKGPIPPKSPDHSGLGIIVICPVVLYFPYGWNLTRYGPRMRISCPSRRRPWRRARFLHCFLACNINVQDKSLQWIKIIKFYKYHISYTIQTSWETWGQEPFRSLNCALSLHAIFHYTSPSLGVKMFPLFFWLQRLRADDVWVLFSWNIWSTQKRFNIGKLLANHLFGDRIGNH